MPPTARTAFTAGLAPLTIGLLLATGSVPLAGLLPPAAGRVLRAGRPLADTPWQLAQLVAAVKPLWSTLALAQLLVTALTGKVYPTVGASGGLFGLLLAYGMMFPNRTIMPLFPPIPMKARTFVMVFGGLELLFGLQGASGVAHFAHLGGMLGGWLMIRYWRGQPPFPKRRRF